MTDVMAKTILKPVFETLMVKPSTFTPDPQCIIDVENCFVFIAFSEYLTPRLRIAFFDPGSSLRLVSLKLKMFVGGVGSCPVSSVSREVLK